jgi:hypothetical protein
MSLKCRHLLARGRPWDYREAVLVLTAKSLQPDIRLALAWNPYAAREHAAF